jgi:hypothetical protein
MDKVPLQLVRASGFLIETINFEPIIKDREKIMESYFWTAILKADLKGVNQEVQRHRHLCNVWCGWHCRYSRRGLYISFH